MINLNNQRRFATIREDLHNAFGHKYSAADIDAKLDEVIAKHSATAKLEEFVPLLVSREVFEHFGEHRIHVRFAAGTNNELAQAAVELTKKHAGDALRVDAAVSHPENAAGSHLPYVLGERGMGAPTGHRHSQPRTVSMPDYIVYLGADTPRDEAGLDIKVWDIADADTVEQTRELADDLEARVLVMLHKLGISPAEDKVALSA